MLRPGILDNLYLWGSVSTVLLTGDKVESYFFFRGSSFSGMAQSAYMKTQGRTSGSPATRLTERL